jgi:hypothetical protein
MIMRRKICLLLLVFITSHLFASDNQTVLLTERDITVKSKEPVQISYAMMKGDKARLIFTSKKDKSLDRLVILYDGKEIFSGKDLKPSQPIEVSIPETSFVNFSFYSNSGSNDYSIRIERVAATTENLLFNTAIQQYKKYDTLRYDYYIDSVTAYTEPQKKAKTFRVVAGVEYESRKIEEKKHKISGQGLRGVMVTKPADTIREGDKELVFIGYQLIITSAASEDKMWKYIGMGIDMGTLALSLAMPVAGTAGGLAINTAFEMIGPQENGEPVYYALMPNAAELEKFKNNQSASCYETGLVTGYSATWPPLDTLAIGIKNLNLAAAINTTVAVYAIYQATQYANISSDILTISPVTTRLKKSRYEIRNVKSWGFQK